MTLLETYELSQLTEFRQRVAAAINKAATDILNEPVNTPNHILRYRWAANAQLAPDIWATKMVWSVIANASIGTNGNASSDNDIQFVVNSLVEMFAAVNDNR